MPFKSMIIFEFKRISLFGGEIKSDNDVNEIIINFVNFWFFFAESNKD